MDMHKAILGPLLLINICCSFSFAFVDHDVSSLETELVNAQTYRNSTRYYTPEELEKMVYGFSIRGSGGGCAFESGFKILNKIVQNGNGIIIQDLNTIKNNDKYVVVTPTGAPSDLCVDNLTIATEVAIRTMSQVEKRLVNGILSSESGICSAMITAYLSKKTGLSLIDADGDGRAVPVMPNAVFPYMDNVSSLVVSSDSDNLKNIAIFYQKNPEKVEERLRELEVQWGGGQIGCVLWSQTGENLKESELPIRNPYYEAFLLGNATIAAKRNPHILDQYLSSTEELIESFDGNLQNFTINSKWGYNQIMMEVIYNNTKGVLCTMYIHALNENLLVTKDKAGKETNPPIITAPHIISYPAYCINFKDLWFVGKVLDK